MIVLLMLNFKVIIARFSGVQKFRNLMVFQIWQQFPCSFEFTEDFLIVLFEHAYSSEYGNLSFVHKNDFLKHKVHSLLQ